MLVGLQLCMQTMGSGGSEGGVVRALRASPFTSIQVIIKGLS